MNIIIYMLCITFALLIIMHIDILIILRAILILLSCHISADK